jgi:lysophospholipase L1-like esterase
MKSQLKRCFALILAVGALLSVGTQSAWAQIKVACVGDSITAGYALTNPWADSYPSQLATILGSGYNVGNFGLSGATVQKRSDYTYWNTSQYRNSLRFKPNVVVIMLGTNDSKPWNWNSAKFNADYKALIAQYQGLQTRLHAKSLRHRLRPRVRSKRSGSGDTHGRHGSRCHLDRQQHALDERRLL